MASLPPRKNPTPTRISRQNLSPLQILLQMGFSKHRAEKALAATGNRGVQLASDWLLAHVNDPFLDDNSPREYILYVCPTGPFLKQLQDFWEKSRSLCGWNGAHNYTQHVTLVSFFRAPDLDAPHLAQSLKTVMERQGAVLNESLKLESYVSPNFMGFFVNEEHADYLKRIAMQYVKEVSNATITLEPHVKSLHLTLAYQFPPHHYQTLKELVDRLDPSVASNWELRLYSRDPRLNNKQVHKVIHPYTPAECDELELRRGDYVYVSGEAVSASPDGWVEGTSWLTGLNGLLPESYTERTAESDAWTLHKIVSINSVTPDSDASPFPEQPPPLFPRPDSPTTPEHSVLERNAKVKNPILPGVPDVESGSVKENFYENLIVQRKISSEIHSTRSVYVMRHGERIDFTFGSWVPYCFDDLGNFNRKDLNMPKNLPPRTGGATAYLKDSPLTNVGQFEAQLVGEALRDRNVQLDHVYCSPSFRCVQTCDALLKGLNRQELQIKVEPGLFEWISWYPEDKLPDWMTQSELIQAGYNVDRDYEAMFSEKEVKENRDTCEQFYMRNAFVTRSALTAHSSGNILLVGHTATLDTCTRELLGKPPRSAKEILKVIMKIPYCSLIELHGQDGHWELVEPPSLPLTHSTNQRFDWKVLL